MAEMSKKKSGRVVTELSRKVLELRSSLGMSQRELSRALKASQVQISEWERGSEKPSSQKLIALGNLAPTAKDRIWFWLKAGLDEKAVRATLAEDVEARIGAPKPEMVIEVPFIKKLSVGEAGELEIVSDRAFSFPTDLLGSAPFVFCLKVDAESKSFMFSPGDLVIVDRSPVAPQSLLGSLVVLFAERRPEYEGVQISPKELSRRHRRTPYISQEQINREDEFLRVHCPEEFASSERAGEDAVLATNKYMDQSVIKIGWLRQQFAGGTLDRKKPFAKQLSCFALELDPNGYSVFLTDWLIGLMPAQVDVFQYVKRPNHIVGRVIGWIRDGAPRSSDAAEQ